MDVYGNIESIPMLFLYRRGRQNQMSIVICWGQVKSLIVINYINELSLMFGWNFSNDGTDYQLVLWHFFQVCKLWRQPWTHSPSAIGLIFTLSRMTQKKCFILGRYILYMVLASTYIWIMKVSLHSEKTYQPWRVMWHVFNPRQFKVIRVSSTTEYHLTGIYKNLF